MRRLYPDIPNDWQCDVVGYIVESDDPGDLGEDMLDVELPNGILISAGWSAESDPNGQYVISASSRLSHVIPPITASDADAAAIEVVRLADTLRSLPNVSDSENQYQATSTRPLVEYVSG